MDNQLCRICDNQKDLRLYQVREMMFATKEQFTYVECPKCGCLQIRDIPDSLEKYYPSNYYSYGATEKVSQRSKVWHYRMFKGLPFRPRSALGKLFKIPSHYRWFNRINPNTEARILDVGGGSGSLLWRLRASGFTHLTGIDPFLPDDQITREMRLFKGDLSRLQEPFDVIMSHHSFEHVPDQRQFLREIKRLLAPNGIVLIRIPVLGEAWHIYGTNWAGLDAPRHLYLHTRKSMQILCQDVGFDIHHVEYDGTDFDFWASIQYQNDIALNSPRSYSRSRKNSLFSRPEIVRFRRQAKAANASGRGDSAAFYLKLAHLSGAHWSRPKA